MYTTSKTGFLLLLIYIVTVAPLLPRDTTGMFSGIAFLVNVVIFIGALLFCPVVYQVGNYLDVELDDANEPRVLERKFLLLAPAGVLVGIWIGFLGGLLLPSYFTTLGPDVGPLMLLLMIVSSLGLTTVLLRMNHSPAIGQTIIAIVVSWSIIFVLGWLNYTLEGRLRVGWLCLLFVGFVTSTRFLILRKLKRNA